MLEPCYEKIDKEKLNKMSTINLIELMRDYDFSRYNEPSMDCCQGNCKCEQECFKIRQQMVNIIYQILKTKPHILNKREAKALRQQRAIKRFKTVSTR